MTCKLCTERGKTWNGDDPKCAFDGAFADNWNCATLNALRDICYEGQNPMPHGVDYQYCDDQKYATVKIDGIEDKRGNRIGLALWVSWYKSRGKTDAAWILSDDAPPRIPTEEELKAITAYYANVTNETRAGERGVSPFELRDMLSGDGTCDLGHIPRVVLWRSGSASFFEERRRYKS